MMVDSDGIYHRLFSHPQMVRDLLMAFLEPLLLSELDLSQMVRQNVNYYAHTGHRRSGDIVWRIPTRQGRDIFLLLMLEFQSRVSWWMAVRIQVYSGLLYQQWIDAHKLGRGDLLPPILPIVLYNGTKPWDAPTETRPLIRLPGPSPLWAYQPEASYYVIDEKRYLEADLKGRDALSALLFRFENAPDPETLPALTEELILWFQNHPDFEALKPLFVELIRVYLTDIHGKVVPHRMPSDLLEAKTMMHEYVDAWKKKLARKYEERGKQIGEKIGEERGEERGERRAAVRFLLIQFQKKFKSIPDWVTAKLADADQETLERWVLRVLDADSLQTVFNDP